MAKKEITYTEAMNEIEQILDRFRLEEMTVDCADQGGQAGYRTDRPLQGAAAPDGRGAEKNLRIR